MSSQQVAKVLCGDFGLEAGLRYAEKIAASGGPLASEYAEAADILRTLRRSRCDECGIYPATVHRRSEALCEGCDSYREHEQI